MRRLGGDQPARALSAPSPAALSAPPTAPPPASVPGGLAPARHLRDRSTGAQPVTTLELFFDLIYVFAVTQLSHLVIDGHLSVRSIVRATFLLVVVWWAWIYTTWLVNWFDPESRPVRLLLLVIAAGSLLMAAAIPAAFGRHALLFALTYAGMQLVRTGTAVVLLDRSHALRIVFERIAVWSVLASILWILGGALPHVRDPLWACGLAVDLLAPLTGYRTPWLGRSTTADWPVDGAHFAERFQGFIIIALGESVVVTGATATTRGLGAAVIGVLALAFLITAILWWLYFGIVAEHAASDLANSEDPGRLARDAYTYLHLPIIAGIIMVAVADDLVVSGPGRPLPVAGALMMTLGPAVYLAGEAGVRLRMAGSLSVRRTVTVLALVIAGVAGRTLPAAALAGVVAAILLALAAVEGAG